MMLLPQLHHRPFSCECADSSGYVNVWHFTSQKCLSSVREDRQTLAVAYSPDYKQYASAGSDRSILLYDAATNKLMSTMEPR